MMNGNGGSRVVLGVEERNGTWIGLRKVFGLPVARLRQGKNDNEDI